MNIQLDRIDSNPAQPRRRFEDLEQLAGSIKADGLLEPIMVRPMGERFQIVHGERRWRACKMAGLAEIDATVREMDDTKAFKLALVENIQRQDLDPMEEADAFTFLQDKGMTQAAIGQLIRKSQQYVADRLALLRLPDQVQHMITARAVNPSLARRLVSIGNKRRQIKLAESAALGTMTIRNLERELESAEMGAERARRVAHATNSEPKRRAAYFDVLIRLSGRARAQHGKPGRSANWPWRQRYWCVHHRAVPGRPNDRIWLGSEVPALLIDVRSSPNNRHSGDDVCLRRVYVRSCRYIGHCLRPSECRLMTHSRHTGFHPHDLRFRMW